jgi:hypothetical protein
MRKAEANLYRVLVWVATYAMDTQLTTVMVPLTTGSVASLEWISIILKASVNVC